MAKHISCDCKCKFNNTTFNSHQKWKTKHVNANLKIIVSAKEIVIGILAHALVRIVSDTSVIMCDEIISVMDIVSAKMKNTIATDVSINSNDKKVRSCYILHTVLLVIILLLIMTAICYHYVKHRSKQKSIDELTT